MYEEGDNSRPRNPQKMMGNREENPGRTGQVLFVWGRAESPAWRWAMGQGLVRDHGWKGMDVSECTAVLLALALHLRPSCLAHLQFILVSCRPNGIIIEWARSGTCGVGGVKRCNIVTVPNCC
jgi:hypothetical protein